LGSQSNTLLLEIVQKLEYYCSYQERCHADVVQKLYALTVPQNQQDEVIVHLIHHNFLNEERFAKLFSISKFHQKNWGKKRITNELKQRNISDYLIRMGLKAIPEEEYEAMFNDLAEKTWNTIPERNALKKRKKFCDTLLRKGWESDWVYEALKRLEKNEE
jgi:regulatory protein